MTFEDFLQSLPGRLSALSHEKCVAFAASCCERALPNFVEFQRTTSGVENTILRQTLDDVWNYLRSGERVTESFQAMKEACLDIAPDSDDFPRSDLAGSAQEASFMVALLAELCADESCIPNAVRIAAFARDTIDRVVQLKRDLTHRATPEFEQLIAFDPLMQTEVKRQESDIEVLSQNSLTPDFLDHFRSRAKPDGRSNIGLATGY